MEFQSQIISSSSEMSLTIGFSLKDVSQLLFTTEAQARRLLDSLMAFQHWWYLSSVIKVSGVT